MPQTSRDAAHVHESSHTCESTTLHAWCSVCGTAQLARACVYACTHTHVHMYTHPHTRTQKHTGSPHVFMSSLPATLSNKLSRLFLIFLSHTAFILSHVHSHTLHSFPLILNHFFLTHKINAFSHIFTHCDSNTHTATATHTPTATHHSQGGTSTGCAVSKPTPATLTL